MHGYGYVGSPLSGAFEKILAVCMGAFLHLVKTIGLASKNTILSKLDNSMKVLTLLTI